MSDIFCKSKQKQSKKIIMFIIIIFKDAAGPHKTHPTLQSTPAPPQNHRYLPAQNHCSHGPLLAAFWLQRRSVQHYLGQKIQHSHLSPCISHSSIDNNVGRSLLSSLSSKPRKRYYNMRPSCGQFAAGFRSALLEQYRKDNRRVPDHHAALRSVS